VPRKTISFLELNKAIAEVGALYMLKITCISVPDDIIGCFIALITLFLNCKKGLRADVMECSFSRR
jgi:hypothetical protein